MEKPTINDCSEIMAERDGIKESLDKALLSVALYVKEVNDLREELAQEKTARNLTELSFKSLKEENERLKVVAYNHKDLKQLRQERDSLKQLNSELENKLKIKNEE